MSVFNLGSMYDGRRPFQMRPIFIAHNVIFNFIAQFNGRVDLIFV